MPALPRAAERPRSRNGFVELFKEEDVHLGWVTVRKTVLLCFLQTSCLPPPLPPFWLPFWLNTNCPGLCANQAVSAHTFLLN